MTEARAGWGFATRAVHVGSEPDADTGAVVPPIHMATTFAQDGVGGHRGYEYGRSGNPTRQALEACLASLEGATEAFTFSSGLAASTTLLMSLLRAGDHVVLGDDVYGGTYRLLVRVLMDFDVRTTSVDTRSVEAVEAAFTERTRLVWLETPTNPLLRLCDIAAISAAAHARGVAVVVDNTFATPLLQRPLELGADCVVHSSTKYLGGHSDVVGGAVLTSDAELAERIRFRQNAVGAVPSPFDCWLLLRGVKTLALRLRQQCASAATIAEFLAGHPAVRAAHYPGLASHPQHQLARRQMRDFGGMVSFDVADQRTAFELLAALRVFTLAESLGAVESLAEHPARMTHASIPAEVRRAVGVGDGLVRLSVGIEDVEDLVADLDRALDSSMRG